MAEKLQVTKFKNALSAGANKIFQKRTVFVFIESWSRDQLMQEAYFYAQKFHLPSKSDRVNDPSHPQK